MIINSQSRKVATFIICLLFLSLSIYLPAQQPGYRAGLYPTIWPTEQGNPNRTKSIVNAGLARDFSVDQVKLESIEMPFPTFIFTRDTNEVFVFGGMPDYLDLYVNAIATGNPGFPDFTYYGQFSPYLMKINPSTMDTLSIDLSGGPGLTYLGGALIHEDGLVYAIANGRIFKIDPSDMTILASLDLPADDMSIVNGMSVLASGKLIAKSTVFGQGNQPGLFFIIDTEIMQIINEVPGITSSARLTIFPDSTGQEYLYHLNRNNTYRMQIMEDTLLLDSTWLAVYAPYGSTENEEPTSPVISNGVAHYTTNTSLSSSRAMKIFWQDLNSRYELDNDTLPGSFMFADTLTRGWNFNGLSIDDVGTGYIIGTDQLNGIIAALRIDKNDQLQYVWEKQYKLSASVTIVSDRGMMYINHFDQEEGFDYIVVLDVLTGNELGRIKTPGRTPSIAPIVPNANGDVYYCSSEAGSSLGFFHRISMTSVITSTSNTPMSSEGYKLYQNYPNPFNSQTTIGFELPRAGKVKLTVYNSLGEQVAILMNEHRPTGIQEVNFDASSFGRGLYYYQLEAANFQAGKKMIIAR